MAEDTIKFSADGSDLAAVLDRLISKMRKFAQSQQDAITVSVKHNDIHNTSILKLEGLDEAENKIIQTWKASTDQERIANGQLKERITTLELVSSATIQTADATRKLIEAEAAVGARRESKLVRRRVGFPEAAKAGGDATLDERKAFKKSVANLTAFVKANKISADRVKRIWERAAIGEFRIEEGVEGQLQDLVFKVKETK